MQSRIVALSVVGLVVACGGGAAAGEAPPTTPSSSESPAAGKVEGGNKVGSAKEAEYFLKLNKEMADLLKGPNDACGTKITGEWTSSWSGHWGDREEYGVTSTARSACTYVLSQIKMACQDAKSPATKKSVAAKIAKVECSYGGPGKMDAQLKGTTLVGLIDPDGTATDLNDAVYKLLGKTL